MSAPVKEDYLEEDPEIRSQKFVLLSFLSPENVLDSKDQFFFGEFLKQYEVDYKIRNLETFLVSIVRGVNDKLTKEADKMDASGADLSGHALTALTEAANLCRKSRLNIGSILESYTSYVKENDKDIKKTAIKEAYDDFMFKNQTKLEEEFFAKNEFRTSIRGLKVRGVTGTHGEAVAMSKKLQRSDTIHNIFLGEVGKWLPWDPKPHQVADQEYAEDQLNTLMKRYKDNEEARDKFVSEQRQELSKGAKKAPVISASDGNPISGESSEGWGSMFGSSGDLAMERKTGVIEKVNVPEDTFEKLA
jgi:thymidylate synthase